MPASRRSTPPAASDLVLRNVNSGAFEVYDLAGNTLLDAASLGQVGLDWQLGGFAVNPAASTSSICPTQPLGSCRQWPVLAIAAAHRTG
jgi:hypothetical protein